MAKVYDRLTIQFMQRRGDGLLFCEAIVPTKRLQKASHKHMGERKILLFPAIRAKVEPYYNDYGTLTPWHKGE